DLLDALGDLDGEAGHEVTAVHPVEAQPVLPVLAEDAVRRVPGGQAQAFRFNQGVAWVLELAQGLDLFAGGTRGAEHAEKKEKGQTDTDRGFHFVPRPEV